MFIDNPHHDIHNRKWPWQMSCKCTWSVQRNVIYYIMLYNFANCHECLNKVRHNKIIVDEVSVVTYYFNFCRVCVYSSFTTKFKRDHAFHVAGKCRRQIKKLTNLVTDVNILEFHDHIWNHHVKYIDKCKNPPELGSFISKNRR